MSQGTLNTQTTCFAKFLSDFLIHHVHKSRWINCHCQEFHTQSHFVFLQESSSAESCKILHNVVEQLVHFRSQVRNFALSVENEATQEYHASEVPQRKRPQPDRLPLLKACDDLRNDLMPLGVKIKVGNNCFSPK